MTRGDEDLLKERFLRADALGPHPEPDLDAITERGRVRRVRRLVSAGFVACFLVVTLVGSLVLLAPMGRRSEEPIVRPGAETSDWSGVGTIAEGTDPLLGHWRLYVASTELGKLWFQTGRVGEEVPLLRPPGPIRGVGLGRSAGQPATVDGIVDSSVTSVVVLLDGERYDATVIALPNDLLPDASFFFAVIPDEQALDGTPWPQGEVIAYDASGNELDRSSFGVDLPPVG
jgi:hypothetical protein